MAMVEALVHSMGGLAPKGDFRAVKMFVELAKLVPEPPPFGEVDKSKLDAKIEAMLENLAIARAGENGK